MEFATMQPNLIKALNLLKKLVKGKPSLPVLAYALLVADENGLALTVSTLQTDVTIKVGARTYRPGAICLNIETLAKLVAKMPKERIDFVLDANTNTVTMTSRGSVDLKGIAATEFPLIAPSKSEKTFEVDASAFKGMIEATEMFLQPAKRHRNPMPVENFYMEVSPSEVLLLTYDHFALAARRLLLDVQGPRGSFMIAPSAMLLLAELLGSRETLTVTLPDEKGKVTFEAGLMTLTTKVVEGRYPDIAEHVYERQIGNRVSVIRTELVRAIKVAQTFNDIITLSVSEEGKLIVRGESFESGFAETAIDAELNGRPSPVRIDGVKLLAVIDVMSDRLIHLNIARAVGIASDSFLGCYAIMPEVEPEPAVAPVAPVVETPAAIEVEMTVEIDVVVETIVPMPAPVEEALPTIEVTAVTKPEARVMNVIADSLTCQIDPRTDELIKVYAPQVWTKHQRKILSNLLALDAALIVPLGEDQYGLTDLGLSLYGFTWEDLYNVAKESMVKEGK